ncbi:hypothetical protein PYW08_006306 [Mythimna loreyi]|uniref:Uncharacterized protein n=1 Tax=Mythimna loreyi TaxID=667449 RepID=A0ACC2QPD4_9NEOP|nr:hypothetical protein PYW08_006306 [Mythimna loreyi]
MCDSPDTRREVVKKALFGEVLNAQLKENYANLKTCKEKQIFGKVVSVPSTSTSGPNLTSPKRRKICSLAPLVSPRKHQDKQADPITPRKRKLIRNLNIKSHFDKKPSTKSRSNRKYKITGLEKFNRFFNSKPKSQTQRELWLQRLPTNVQAILTAQGDLTLDKVAEQADKILEVNPVSAHAISPSTASAPDLAAITAQMQELAQSVRPLPKAPPRKNNQPKRCKIKSAVLSGTPVKHEMAAIEASKKIKSEKKRVLSKEMNTPKKVKSLTSANDAEEDKENDE